MPSRLDDRRLDRHSRSPIRNYPGRLRLNLLCFGLNLLHARLLHPQGQLMGTENMLFQVLGHFVTCLKVGRCRIWLRTRIPVRLARVAAGKIAYLLGRWSLPEIG